jgi:hypothetical protein
LSKARIWRHHRPELVEFVIPGKLFMNGHDPVQQMIKHTEIDGMKKNRQDNSHWRDACHIPEDASCDSYRSNSPILNRFSSLCVFSLSHHCHVLVV